MPSYRNIAEVTDGYTFEFVSKTPVKGAFRCICHGKEGYSAYEVKRDDGQIYKVGKDCLKHCGLSLQ